MAKTPAQLDREIAEALAAPNSTALIEGRHPLYGHTSDTKAYIVDDYPYGFRERSKIKYWLEHKPKKGWRFVSQTLNPNTFHWNKPRVSTYTEWAAAMYLDTKGHVHWVGVGPHSDEHKILAFVTVFPGADMRELRKVAPAKLRFLRGLLSGEVFMTVNKVRQPRSEADGRRRKNAPCHGSLGRNRRSARPLSVASKTTQELRASMSKADINVSGACGSGSSTKIYVTPEYNYPWQGAHVMHGSFTTELRSPSNQRIEVVELCVPGLSVRVRADDVRVELRALLAANTAWEIACCSEELQPARYQAFVNLQAAVFVLAKITVTHIEQIVRKAYADGLRHGEESMREQFRKMLGL